MTIDLNDDECRHILSLNRYGHLGCVDGGEPYVVPVTYVFRDGEFYGYTFEGKKIGAMRSHPKVCVQVEDVVDGTSWVSVIAWGDFEEITAKDEVQRVKLLFGRQHGESSLAGERPLVSPGIERLHLPVPEDAVLYRIVPYRMTGKRQRS